MKPNRETIAPVIRLLAEAPMPVAVARAPCIRLNRPVPAGQVGDHQDADHAEDPRPDPVQELDRDQGVGVRPSGCRAGPGPAGRRTR